MATPFKPLGENISKFNQVTGLVGSGLIIVIALFIRTDIWVMAGLLIVAAFINLITFIFVDVEYNEQVIVFEKLFKKRVCERRGPLK